MEEKRCISRTRFTERRLDVSSMETLDVRPMNCPARRQLANLQASHSPYGEDMAYQGIVASLGGGASPRLACERSITCQALFEAHVRQGWLGPAGSGAECRPGRARPN
jgi:hypothetical protein